MMVQFSGAKLREIRLRAGLSQEVLAQKIGQRASDISRMENSRTNDPRGTTVIKIARAVRCAAEELYV